MRKKEVATLGDDARGVFADLDAPFVKHVQGGIRFLGGGEDVEVEVVGASRLGVEAERQGAAHRVFDPRGTQHSADLYGEFRRRQLFRLRHCWLSCVQIVGQSDAGGSRRILISQLSERASRTCQQPRQTR